MGWFGRRKRPGMSPLVAVDPDHFRRVLSHFCSGVVAVTAVAGGRPVGLTCQSFSSLSLDPPLVMFGAARASRSWPDVRRVGRFAVNILGADQEEISRTFARTGVDKFAGLTWRPGATGAPLIDGALAHVECELVAVHDGGDHEIAVGRVLALAERAEETHPLLFFRSEYRSLRGAPDLGLPPSPVDR
jgi:3-hydroxy-9,10-secoandrosta-1,3,5(10)-triene-9,17-dione monooxygenase reductase component